MMTSSLESLVITSLNDELAKDCFEEIKDSAQVQVAKGIQKMRYFANDTGQECERKAATPLCSKTNTSAFSI